MAASTMESCEPQKKTRRERGLVRAAGIEPQHERAGR
jgi:hypothetical protein